MADSFDPYHKWLGISPKDQPPNHYRLLAIELFENDLDVIEGAADRQMAHVRTFQTGQNSAASQRILNELSAAKLCLLDPKKKAEYDRQLREKIERVQAAAVTSSGVVAPGGTAGASAPTAPARPVPIAAGPAPLAIPLTQSGGMPAVAASPTIVPGVPTATPPIHKRPYRKAPAWRQPAVLGTVGALVLFSAVAYFLAASGKLPTEVAKNQNKESRLKEGSPSAPETKAKTDNTVSAAPKQSGSTPANDSARPDSPTEKQVSPRPGREITEIKPAPPVPEKPSMPVVVEPRAPRQTAPAPGERSLVLTGEPIDLLKQIDVGRDAVRGDWKMENGVLVTPREQFSKLLLPRPPAEEYRLVAAVERLGGRYGLGVILKVGEHRVMLSIDGYNGHFSGLENIIGKNFPTHESTYKGRLLEDGKLATVVYTVRRNSIEVELDGRQIVHWEGDPATLVLPPDWQVPDPSRLALSEFDTMLRIHKLQIAPLVPSLPSRSVASAPKPVDHPSDEPASPPAMQPPRTLADLTSNNARRSPVPDGEALKKAKQEMRKKFASSMKAARSPEQKRRLAQQLAQKASAAEGAQAYVLFGQAVDLAEAVGDLDLAWQTIDALTQAFEVDRLALHNESLAAVGKGVKSPEAAWTLTDAACRLMVSALASGDAAAVKKAGTQAQSFAKRLNDRAAQKDVTDRANDAGTLVGQWDAVVAAREKLETSPDDAEANFTVGHYELCAAGNWAAALPKLAKCGDSTWRKLAADELALDRQTFNTVRQAPTADGWWSLAESEPWPGRHFLQMRAARRYRTSNRGRMGDTRLLAVERLKTLLALDDGLPNWELFQWRAFPQTFEPTGDVARIEGNGNVETAAEYSGPIEVLLIAKTSGTRLQFMSHRWGWSWDFTLVPDQWHALRYAINPLSRTVFVDGVVAQTETWRTPRQFNPGPVSFSVNDDSVLEIRKFIVKEQ